VENENALKHLFDKLLLLRMGVAIQGVYPAFDWKYFSKLMRELEPLEMKDRVRFIREELRRQLPREYPEALRILLKSKSRGQLDGFDLWPYSDFVQTYGLDDLKLSLDALKALTPLFSSEFAVRPFLIRHQVETLKYLERCARNKDPDIRRWACEGTRPRLPWGERLQEFVRDPSFTLPILELLKFDPELYVRKSVSNHLNDISKDHPERVIRILSAWKKSAGSEHGPKVEWIIHRALRNLIKAGHPGAFRLIGVSPDVRVELSGFKVNQKEFRLGERLEFEFKIRSLTAQSRKFVVDYIIHFAKANQKTSPKVFKLKTMVLAAKGEILITKSHHLKAVTTRAHYPGLHYLEIQVNGLVLRREAWRLVS
jgi:3-methyladenine DNA glycosylase AlkC